MTLFSKKFAVKKLDKVNFLISELLKQIDELREKRSKALGNYSQKFLINFHLIIKNQWAITIKNNVI
jgi:hypothetical protein